MTTPPFPADLVLEAAVISQGVGTVEELWPRLYAAALRHAATLCEYDEMAGFDCLTPSGLRTLADKAEAE